MISMNTLHLLLVKLLVNQHQVLIEILKKLSKKCLIKFKNHLKDIVLKIELIFYLIHMFYINFFNFLNLMIMSNAFLSLNLDKNLEFKMRFGKKYVMIVIGNFILVYDHFFYFLLKILFYKKIIIKNYYFYYFYYINNI